MNVFRFRAECRTDVDILKKLLPNASFKTKPWKKYFPDVIVTIKTEFHIEIIKQFIADVELIKQEIAYTAAYGKRSNVMMQTLAKASKYTGRRVQKPYVFFSVN